MCLNRDKSDRMREFNVFRLPKTIIDPASLSNRVLIWLTSGLGLLWMTGCGLTSGGYNVQGVNQFQQGQYQAALQSFQHVIATNPRDADAQYNLASTYHRMGTLNGDETMLKQAESVYNQCLEVDGNHTDCHRALAVLLVETGRPESAFRLLEGWSLRQPHVGEAKIELARLYEEFGDNATAISHLEDALVADTNNSRAWAALGKLREQTGDHTQALANYQRSYQLNRMQPGVATRIASLQSGLSGPIGPATQAGTRVVTQPPVTPRY